MALPEGALDPFVPAGGRENTAGKMGAGNFLRGICLAWMGFSGASHSSPAVDWNSFIPAFHGKHFYGKEGGILFLLGFSGAQEEPPGKAFPFQEEPGGSCCSFFPFPSFFNPKIPLFSGIDSGMVSRDDPGLLLEWFGLGRDLKAHPTPTPTLPIIPE